MTNESRVNNAFGLMFAAVMGVAALAGDIACSWYRVEGAPVLLTTITVFCLLYAGRCYGVLISNA